MRARSVGVGPCGTAPRREATVNHVLVAGLFFYEASARLGLFQPAQPRPLWQALVAAGVVVAVIVIVSWRLAKPSESEEDEGD